MEIIHFKMPLVMFILTLNQISKIIFDIILTEILITIIKALTVNKISIKSLFFPMNFHKSDCTLIFI